MKRLPNTLLYITSCVSLIALFLLLFSKSVSAQTTPSPACSCNPGDIGYDCYQTIPDGWCKEATKQGNEGRGKEKTCNADCLGWTYTGRDVCTTSCDPPKPQITPINYSFKESVGDFNEWTEGKVHSGTRDQPIDPTKIDNYGAVAALAPAGIANELRVKFIKLVKARQDRYEVYLTDGTKKEVQEIWNECTENGDLDNWQEYQDKLDNCPQWGFVPTTYRRLASEPTPAVKTQDRYFKDRESPFVLGWGGLGIPLEWIINFFRNLFCSIFPLPFCPDSSLPLRNPDNLSDWTKGKPNIPQEAVSNAQLLRQWLLPKGLPLGPLPTGASSYFDTWSTDPKTVAILKETGQATQQTSAEGGLFRIFQPQGINPNPAFCKEDAFNPPEKCASEYYFKLINASPGTCLAGNVCYSDTPDEKTMDLINRPVDDRPLYLRTGMEFFQQSLWPAGLTPR